MKRLPFTGTVAGAVLLTGGLLVMGSAMASSAAQADDVQRDVQRSTAAFDAYFDRARSMDLLLAQNPVFQTFYTDHHGRREALKRGGPMVDKMNHALGYLERLYPGRIGEACFIDETGAELARVVNGKPAAYNDLSLNETKNPFFFPTLRTPAGGVYQAAPYKSPDTKQWVISNSTTIEPAPGHRALVHFEVTLDSFLPYLPETQPNTAAVVVDRETGQVILQRSQTSVSEGTLMGQVPDWAFSLRGAQGERGALNVAGHEAQYRAVDQSSGNSNDWLVVEWSTRNASPVPSWVGLLAAIAGALLIMAALLALRWQQQSLRAAARLDHLTGLANRPALEEALARAIASSATDARSCGVLVLDLDGFKQINDALGHHRGDQVLQEIARRLHTNTFEFDTVARLGGDEFAVVVSRLADPEDALAVATRLHDALVRPIELDGIQRFVGASVGAAVFPDHGQSVEQLLRNADAAMYRVKRDRGLPRLYEPGTAAGMDELQQAAELLAAIERGEIVLQYQPEFDLQTGELVAVEALARWNHPERGLLPPSEFIPLSERTGLIRPLTTSTFKQAIDQAREWRAAGHSWRVSVNLSAVLLSDATLAQEILGALEASDLPGSMLTVEITESGLVSDRVSAVRFLSVLRAGGVRTELDDFGSGYASFGYLRDLPLDAVKLDRSLVAGLLVEQDSRDILRCTADLVRRLGMQVTAEGVEKVAQADMLRDFCDVAQGFLYARPVPAGDIVAFARLGEAGILSQASAGAPQL